MIRVMFVFTYDLIVSVLFLALLMLLLWGGCKVINSTLPVKTPNYAPVEENKFDFEAVKPRMGQND